MGLFRAEDFSPWALAARDSAVATILHWENPVRIISAGFTEVELVDFRR
jgi:hypothetical protein